MKKIFSMKCMRTLVFMGCSWGGIVGGSIARAQVSLYEFSESVGVYNEIPASDGVVSLGVPAFWPHVNNNRAWVNNPFNDPDGQVTQNGNLNPAMGPGYPIGFDFEFNGDVFDVIGISNGGWVSFGKSSDGLQAVWVYNWSGTSNGDPFLQWYNGPEPSYKRNRVAGFGNSSLQQVDWTSLAPPGQYSSLRMTTLGVAPNRVCVVQWKDYGLRNDVTVAMNKINFQIRLHEADNSVEVVFGPMDWVSGLGRYLTTQVGLSGRSNADFNGRMTVYQEPVFLYDWNATEPADNNQAFCQFTVPQIGQPNGSGVPPVQGLTWHWYPPVCPPPAWPLTIASVAFDGANVTWSSSGSEEYEYFVSTENDINGPEVASGTVTDTEVYVEGLEPTTTYYVFVRGFCDGAAGTWGVGTEFKTYGGGFLACPGQPTEGEICSAQHSTYYWHYVSADGFSPVKIELTDGFVGANSLQFWHGSDDSGPPGFTVPSGDITGQTWTSVGSQLFIRLQTDAGACEAQPWYLPVKWRLGCKDCTDPLVNYSVVPDCENNEFSVEVDVFSMGATTTLLLQNSLGVAQTEANVIGLHTVGPFTAGTAVSVTAANSDNPMCYSESPAMIAPCSVVDCGPTEYTLCYGDNTWIQRAYQGSGGQEIGIRFLAGSIGYGDNARTYNGADPEEVAPTPLPSVALNTLVTSGAPSTDHTLVLELVSDNSHSCLDEDPLYGTSTPWRYIVACYDGCVQPQATFTRTCLSQTQFEVAVNITVLGNTSSVVINNNGGAASVTATSIGTYTVGPFTAGTPVTLDVMGASVLCTWTSPAQNPDCSTIGIDEISAGRMQLYPNPTEGAFRVELPTDMTGRTELQVLDLAGRVVAQEVLNTPTGTTLDLGHLPNGLYTVVAFGNGKRVSAKVGIQH